ncbi:phage tail-collar fiber domain-containing protein [Fusobacterium varium]
MAYNGLTNAGAAYLAARQANNLPVEFLKAKVGNGIVPSGTDPADLTDIISEKMEVEITDIQQAERTLKMTVQVSNESLTTGFYLTEIAIFVNDNGTQVLYWYIGKDNGIPVHDSTKPMKYKNILNIEVSSTPVTTVNYTGKDLWIDEETLNAKFGTKEKEILEGIQLARTLGLEYGGELNNSNTKKLNTVYYDTQNKSFFKCFRENTLNYADSNYYEGISNNDLLLKLQNLSKVETYYKTENGVVFAFKRIGNMIIYNSSNKIDFSVVGKAKIFTIDNPRFIPRYDAYICSVVSLSTVYDGSINPSGEITLNFGSSPVQPFIAIQGIGIAKD